MRVHCFLVILACRCALVAGTSNWPEVVKLDAEAINLIVSGMHCSSLVEKLDVVLSGCLMEPVEEVLNESLRDHSYKNLDAILVWTRGCQKKQEFILKRLSPFLSQVEQRTLLKHLDGPLYAENEAWLNVFIKKVVVYGSPKVFDLVYGNKMVRERIHEDMTGLRGVEEGMTLAHIAISPHIIVRLSKIGSLNIPDRNGLTPVMACALKRNETMSFNTFYFKPALRTLQLLVLCGADPYNGGTLRTLVGEDEWKQIIQVYDQRNRLHLAKRAMERLAGDEYSYFYYLPREIQDSILDIIQQDNDAQINQLVNRLLL